MAERGSSQLNHLDTEIHVDYSYPLSIPSQPPDIRNWFSSYEYESPDPSDLPQALGGSFKLPENDDSDAQDPWGISESQDQRESSPIKDEFILDDEYHTQLKDGRNVPAEIKRKCDDSVNQNIACSYPVGNGNSIRDDLSGRPAARLKRKLNLQQVLKGYAEEADGNDPASDRSRIQEAEARVTKDGFIFTKMRQNSTERGGILPPMSLSMNRENLTPKQLRSAELKKNEVVLAGREESELRRASPLADRTNVQVEQGIPGRWQCPRKGKPYSGPPLKQLRLERWVRRSN